MANPQPDKYIKFSIELAEEMAKRHFPGNEQQILWVVWRKTWGWNKKSDKISISQMAEASGLSRPRAAAAYMSLVRKSVLVHIRKSGLVNEIGFQKDFDLWTSPEKRTSVPIRKSVHTSPEKRTSASGSTSPEKRIHNRHKDILQKTGLADARYATHDSLKSEDICRIADKYQINIRQVNLIFDQLKGWKDANKVKDWNLTLQGWVARGIQDGKLSAATKQRS